MFIHRHSAIRALGMLAAAMLTVTCAWAQEVAPEERLLNSDPRKLLDLVHGNHGGMAMTTIGDLERREVRNSPVQVQVITARQIEASMARDLLEALELVPGLSFARMAGDGIGVMAHGLWGGEGRFLFLLDGEPLNENEFGSFSLGSRVPLVNVERIEVVTGPASSLHGGNAGLGVVNIVTRTADQANGARLDLRTGFSNNAFTNRQALISGANRLSRDQEISYLAGYGRGHRSNALFQLPDSTWLNYADSTEMLNNVFQLGYGWRGLRAHMSYLEQVNMVSDRPYSMQRRDVVVGGSFNRNFNHRLNLLACVTYHDQLPGFRTNTTDPGALASNTGNIAAAGRTSLGYKPKDWLDLRIGGRYQHITSRYLQRSGNRTFSLNNERSIAMGDGAVFGLLAIHTKLGSFHGGYQSGRNSLTGSFQAPRLSYVFVHKAFHGKLIWSRGYRIPALMNLEGTVPEVPMVSESTESKDIELGLRIPHGLQFTITAFQTSLFHPITLTELSGGAQAYTNGADMATTGLDARASWETKRWTMLAGFGRNRPATEYQPMPEEAYDRGHGLHLLPGNRGYLVMAVDLFAGFTLRAKATWQDRTSSLQADGAGRMEWVEWPEETVISGGFAIKPGKTPRLSIELECRNITNTRRIIPGLPGNVMPLVLNGREYAMALTYKFNQ